MTRSQKFGLIIGGFALALPLALSAEPICYPQWCTGTPQLVSVLPESGPAPLTVVAAVKPRYIREPENAPKPYVSLPFFIEWGDGSTTDVPAGESSVSDTNTIVYKVHIYAAQGTYTVKVKEPPYSEGEVGRATVTVGAQGSGGGNPPAAPAPLVVLLVNPASINAGGSASVIWASSNAKSCTGTNFTATGVAGYVSVNPAQTTTYSITCTGDGGSVTQSATLTVTGGGGGGGTDTGPRGWLDSVSAGGTAVGWAQDVDAPSLAIDAHFYTVNASGTKEFIGSTNANQYRADLCTAIGSCNHGFTFNVPAKYLDGQSHVIHAYGINAQGGSDKNLELSGSPKTVTFTGSGGGENFKASPQSGAAPLTVGFTGNTNRINSVIDFGDGTSRPVTNFADPPAGTSLPLVAPFAETYTYQAAGTYTAKLKNMNVQCVTTPCDGEVIGTVTITVTGGTSNPDKFSGTPTSGTAPLTVQFVAKSLAQGTIHTLNFGDGLKVTLLCPLSGGGNTCAQSYSHTYTANGTYTAILSRSLACHQASPPCDAPEEQIGTITITVGSGGGASCLVIENDLGQGDTDDDTNGEVSKLQAFLAKDPAIYPEGKVTGFYGGLTFKAVQRYQKKNGIPETGYVGPKTRAALACKDIPSNSVITLTISPTTVMQGATTTIAWSTVRPPADSAISLRLLSESGKRRGLIAVGLATTSSFSWRIPYLSGDPFDIIEGIANCDGNTCAGTLAAGKYKIQAALYTPANAFEDELPTKVVASSTPTLITVTAKQ